MAMWLLPAFGPCFFHFLYCLKLPLLLTCLETACEEDAAKKLVHKAGITDQVFPEEITKVYLLKLLPQGCKHAFCTRQQSA